MTRRDFHLFTSALPAAAQSRPATQPLQIGSRRELAIDHLWIDSLHHAELRPGAPIDAGLAFPLDRPWEGAFSAYSTVLHAPGEPFRMYYRGSPEAGRDGNTGEVTCYAESPDGIRWSKPDLGLFEVFGTRKNNVILAQNAPFSHNFTPFIDTRPGVPAAERFKAIAGVSASGLRGYISPDGLQWRPIRPEPLLPPTKQTTYDSQNLAFWSSHEHCYALYYRTWKRINNTNYRHVSRVTSPDFLRWSAPEEIDYGAAPPEHLYTNQTAPYFRAPHIYTGICARFMPGRQVLSEEQARNVGVNPKYFKDCSDVVLVTSRGGNRFERTFMEAFLRPGLGLENWVSRSNYPALNLVQTAPGEMSFYVNRNYGQPTAHVQRYKLRLDGFGSIHAGYQGGEVITKPLILKGDRLALNYSTSAAGSIRVEVQDPEGKPLKNYDLLGSFERIGDEIEGVYAWKQGPEITSLAGRPIRLRFVLKDADLYAFQALLART